MKSVSCKSQCYFVVCNLGTLKISRDANNQSLMNKYTAFKNLITTVDDKLNVAMVSLTMAPRGV